MKILPWLARQRCDKKSTVQRFQVQKFKVRLKESSYATQHNFFDFVSLADHAFNWLGTAIRQEDTHTHRG
jgi:hypothetical protein